jgi:hypothetical protein
MRTGSRNLGRDETQRSPSSEIPLPGTIIVDVRVVPALAPPEPGRVASGWWCWSVSARALAIGVRNHGSRRRWAKLREHLTRIQSNQLAISREEH